MLPECRDRFDRLDDDLREIKVLLRTLQTSVSGYGGKSLDTRVTRMETLWKIFAVVGATVSLLCVIAGTAYAIFG